jgi:hypothetical protein
MGLARRLLPYEKVPSEFLEISRLSSFGMLACGKRIPPFPFLLGLISSFRLLG